MSSNNQPLSGNSFTPIQRSSLNSLITSIILDSDTGDSSFLIRTGNNSSFYIDKFSNVGINTTSPGTQLEVASSNGSCLRLRYGATSALANIYVSSSGNLSLNPSGGELNTNGNFNIAAHNGSTSGLLLNGTLVLSTAVQLNYVTVTAGTASASKAVVLDSNRDITNIRYLTASQLTGTIQTASQPNITSVGTLTSLTVGDIEITGALTVSGGGGSINTALGYLTGVTPGTALASKALILDSSSNVTGISGIGTTSITIGGNIIGATQSAYLTSITAGTAAANKALIVDGSRDIANIRYLTASQLTGTLQTAAQPNITSIGTLTNITIGSNTLGNTEAAYLTSVAAGTASANKVLVLDGSRDITNIRNLTATNLYGMIQTSSQTNITSVGILSQLTVNGATAITSATDATSSTAGGALTIDGGLAVAKAAFIGTNLTVGGNLIVSGTTTTVNSSTLSVKDNIILLNSSPAGSYDGGIIVQRYQPISNTVIGDVVADTAKETTTVSSATSNTVVLTVGNAANNYYNGWWIKINSDIRYVSGYVGSTKTVTVSTTFSSTPTASTSVFLYNRSNAAFTWNESNKQFAATYNANDSSTTLTTLDYADIKVAGLFTLNPINISDATESSSTSTGSIITSGGVGIAKALRVGNGIYGTIQTAAQTSITSVGTLTSLVVSGSITTNGAAFSSTEINYLLSLTPGTATASKALVLDSNSNISGIASMSATSVTIGGNVIGATQSAYLTGISVGTASAGKALVVDSNLDITSIRYLTATHLTGQIQTAAQPNITSIGTLTSITIGSNTLTNTQAAYLTSITVGTASAGKALVVDSNLDIASIRYLTATQLTGTLQTAAQPNITSIGTLTNITIGSTTLGNTEAAYLTSITAGTASASKALILDSSTNITGINSIGTTTLVLGGTSLGTTQAAYLTSITPGTASASKALVLDSSKNISGIGTIANSYVNDTSSQLSYQTWTNGLAIPISVNLAISNAAPVFGTSSNHKMRFITNGTIRMWLQTSGNVSIGVDDDTYKLNVNGSLNATSYYSSGSLVSFGSISGVTAGTASASKALILDASINITGINSVGTTTLVLGGNSLGATQSGYLTGITAGTATAGKALIVDGSVNIAGINSLSTTSLTVNGTDVSAAITASGYVTGITPGTGTASKALVLDSSSNITTGVNSFNTTTLILGGNSLGATESAYLTSITAGTAAASKALIVDSSRNIVNINALTASQLTGTLQTAAQTNITSVGTLTGLAVSTASNGGISLRRTDASTTSISYPLEVCHYLTGSVAGGIGVGAGMTFNAPNGSGGVISYGRMYAVSTDVTLNAHAGGLGFSTVFGGNFINVLTLTSSSTTNCTLALAGASSTISATNLTGTLTTAAQTNITSVGTLSSLSTGNITLNGTLITSTAAQLNYVAGVTAGTAIASKALVLDSSKNIAGVGSIGLTGENVMLDLYAATASNKSAVTLRNDTRTIEYGIMGTTAAAKANMFYIFNNAAYALLIDSNSNIGIGADPNSSYKLNTTTLNATSYYVSGSLVDMASVSYLNGITAGTVSASKAIVVDASSNITSGLNSVTMSTLVLGSNIITSSEIAVIDGVTAGTAANNKALVLNGSGSITGISSISTTTITIGGSQLDGTEAGYLDSVVAGTAAASKALVLNASSNITTGINSLTMSSLILGSNTLSSTEAGYLTSITPGTAAASKALVLNSSSNITTGVNSFATTTLVLGGNSLGATESAYLTSITAGTAAASKALILNSSSNITSGLNSLTATSLVTTNFTLNGTLVSVTGTELNVLGSVTAGTASASKALVLNSSSNISGINSLSSSYLVVPAGSTRNYTTGTQSATISSAAITYNNTSVAGTDSTAVQAGALFVAPTYTATNAITTPIAATLAITGSPVASTNQTITAGYALYITSGTTYFGGNINAAGTVITTGQLGVLAGVTAGAVSASKVIVVDGSSNINSGLNSLTATSLVTTNFNLGGTSVTSTAAQLNFLSGVTAGTATASKALVLNSSSNITTGLNSLTATSLVTTNFSLGGTSVTASAAEINVLTGATAGTAVASKALVLDSSLNIATINSLTATSITGTLQTAAQANITSTGNLTLPSSLTITNGATPLSISNTASTSTFRMTIQGVGGAQDIGSFTNHDFFLNSNNTRRLRVDAGGDIDIISHNASTVGLKLGGTLITASAAEINVLDGVTAGTVAVSKALVVDSNKDLASLRNLTLTGTLSGVTTLGLSGVLTSTNATATTTNANGALVLSGGIGISNTTDATSSTNGGTFTSAGGGSFAKKIYAGGQIITSVLGQGFSHNDGVINLVSFVNNTGWPNAYFGTTTNHGLIIQTNNVGKVTLDASGSVDISLHNGSTIGLELGGVLVTASASDLNYTDITNEGIGQASKALILNSSSNITSGLNSLTATSLVTTNFSLGGTSVTATAAQLNFLSGVTAGTAAASKALVLNSSNIITTGISSLTIGIGRAYTSGTQCANIVIPSQTFVNQNGGGTDSTFQSVLSISSAGLNAPNAGGNPIVTTNAATVYIAGAFGIGSNISITNNYSLYVAAGTAFFGGNVSVNSFTLGGTSVTATAAELNYLDITTTGTAQASKALVLDSSLNITGINNLSMGGILTVGTIGSSDNRINFKGVNGDSSDNFTVLAERLYGATDFAELLLFKGNDSSGGSGPDRIRLRAPEIRFQIASEIYTALADNGDIMIIQNDTSVSINTLLSIGANRNYASSSFGANININDCTLSNSYTAASSTDAGHFKKVSIGVTTLTTVVNTAVTTTNASTLFIQSAPVAGTRMTITNAYALYVNSGKSFFGGETTINSGGNSGLRLINANNGTSDNCNILFTNNNRSFELGIRSAAAATGPANGFYIYDNANAAMRFSINSSGNVGIGHNAPQARLDMGSTAGDRILAVYAGASGGDFYGLGANSNATLYHTKSSHTFYAGSTVGATGTQVFTVGSDGNAFASAGLHASGFSALSSGAGAHIHYAISQAQFFGYDYSAGQYKDVSINNGSIYAKTSAGAIGYGVGINTTTMNAALTVLGNSNFLDGSFNKCIQAIGAGGVSIMIEPHSGTSATSTNSGWIGTNTTNDLRFGTDNSTRMIITSGGNVGIGTNTPGVLLDVNGTASCIKVRATSGSTSACFIGGWDDSGYWGLGEHGGVDTVRLGKCDASGSWSGGRSSLTVQTLFYAGSLTSDSDYRLKTDIIPLSYGLNEILNLNPKKYKLLSDEKIYYGLIAHEVQEQLPDIVTGEKDKINANNEPVYQGVDYVKITPVLINAIKELHNKNVELEQTIQNQNNLINDILVRLQQLEN